MALFVFAVATAALRMQAFALGAIERPPLPRMAASMLEQGPERPTAAVVPPPRRLTDLIELEQTKDVPQKQGALFTGRTRRVVRRGVNVHLQPDPQKTSPVASLRAFGPHQRAWSHTRRSARLHLAQGRLEGQVSHLREHDRTEPCEVAQHTGAVCAQEGRGRSRGAAVNARCLGNDGCHGRWGPTAWRVRRDAAGRLTRQRGAKRCFRGRGADRGAPLLARPVRRVAQRRRRLPPGQPHRSAVHLVCTRGALGPKPPPEACVASNPTAPLASLFPSARLSRVSSAGARHAVAALSVPRRSQTRPAGGDRELATYSLRRPRACAQ